MCLCDVAAGHLEILTHRPSDTFPSKCVPSHRFLYGAFQYFKRVAVQSNAVYKTLSDRICTWRADVLEASEKPAQFTRTEISKMKYEGKNLLCSQCLKPRQALKKGDNGSKYFVCTDSSLQRQTKAWQTLPASDVDFPDTTLESFAYF